MTINWLKFGNYLWDNKTAIGVFSYGVMTASIKVWPTPDKIWFCKQTVKEFLYDFPRQQFNLPNNRLNKNDTPKIPENGQK